MAPKEGGTIKLVALISRRAGMTPEEFEDYYEKYHAPLSLRLHSKTFYKYTRNFIQHKSPFSNLASPLPAPCDVITEVWFKNEEDLRAFMEHAAKPEVRQQILEDEGKFMDRNALRMFIVNEYEG